MGHPIRRLFLATFFLALAFFTWRSVLDNFLVQELGAAATDRGLLESVREVPGLFSFLLMASVVGVSEPLLGCFCLLFIAVGNMAFSRSQSILGTLLPMLIASVGLHLWIPINQSLLLSYSEDGGSGRALATAKAISALAALVGSAVVYQTVNAIGFRGEIMLSAFAAVAGAGVMLSLPRRTQRHPPQRILVRRRYRLFYTLSMLDGCRRQVFLTFAVFALVKIHGATVREVALLIAASQALNVFVQPFIGRAIDRYGERRLLLIGAAIPAVVFTSYAFVTVKWVLFAMYCVDAVCLGTNVARTTYLGKIAPPEEVLPSLSFGLTMNHVIAVPLPLVGGKLWDLLGHAWTFMVGATIAVVTVAVASLVPRKAELDALDATGAERGGEE